VGGPGISVGDAGASCNGGTAELSPTVSAAEEPAAEALNCGTSSSTSAVTPVSAREGSNVGRTPLNWWAKSAGEGCVGTAVGTGTVDGTGMVDGTASDGEGTASVGGTGSSVGVCS
jgi:hypothetical protein